MTSNRAIKKVISTIISELKDIYPIEEINSFIRLIFEYYFDYSQVQLRLNNEKEISVEKYKEIFRVIDDLKSEKPIQYILNEAHFYDLKFKVSPAVLIPRQETEELVDWIIKENTKKELSILDIGTGSGCIAISLARNIADAKVSALDVSDIAIELAKQNSTNNNTVINFIQIDILNVPDSFASKFDVIVSNPPYVTNSEKMLMQKNVLENEPHLALFVPDKNPLVFYDAISSFAVRHLNKEGKLFFEINESFGMETKALMEEKGFYNIEVRKDLNGKDRMVSGVLR